MSKLTAGRSPGQAAARHCRRRCRDVVRAAALLLSVSGPAGAAGGVSPWAGSDHAAARLLAAGPGPGGAVRLAGVEIRLDPGYITYWRNPGDAGVPPTFDTAGSTNVAAVTVDYPAPQRLDEAGAQAFGYTDVVTFPLHVTPADATRPVVLVVALDYAVCATLCLPAKARLELGLPPTRDPEAAAVIDAALAATPRPAALGAAGPLAIESLVPQAGGATSAILATVRAHPGATLFVEAPDGWYLQSGEPTPDGSGQLGIPIAILQRPEGATLAGLALRLTLVDASGAIDVRTRMDAVGATP